MITILRSLPVSLRSFLRALRADPRGEAYLDVAMKILITVVIGAAVLLILNNTMPDLFKGLIQKVTSVLSGVTVSVTPSTT